MRGGEAEPLGLTIVPRGTAQRFGQPETFGEKPTWSQSPPGPGPFISHQH